MRTLAAIVAYVLAALGGLAAGYYATAPRTAAAPVSASAPRHEAHTWSGKPADLEAVAAFLAAEEARAADDPAARPSAGL